MADIVASLQYHHAVASTVGATGKKLQLVLCSNFFTKSQTCAINC